MSELVQIPVRINQINVSEEDPDTSLILDKINRLTLEPFRSMEEFYVFSGICSNDRLDSYYTKMDPETTLRNYTNDLKQGVSLLPSHDIMQSPFGRSYDGVLENNEVDSYWYIVRDLTINGEKTNDTIRAIQTGIKRDLSVGFGGDRLWYKCSSCGRDMWDWECPHFPGLEDENDMRTFAWIMDAHLREVSTVYKGATPGAYINKARQFVEQGDLPYSEILKLENAYNIRLDNGKRSFYMPKNETKEDEEMTQAARNNLLDDIRSAIRENKIEKAVVYDILSEEGDPFRQPEDIALRNELGKDYSSIQAIRQLKKEAQQGRRYLADVIDQAVAARVKAHGDTFNAESYRTMLSLSGDIDHIKEEIDSYERIAKQRFTPGRQTEPENLGKEEEEEPTSEGSETRFEEDDNIFTQGSAE
ncbi:hypothetical protein F7731_23590 [Cytobacillus depressus]|uniref:Uncharacterized protein n=1 Tax=Cytobacillus depressus TaxID=1602942 RepID=A0A6L3V4I7_9BACI|nr:hypothetical protein [Cytobacillus depressus]KAB2328939.1 hypothetical protein F7731_23590 [Cytobacillus depressus]